MEGENKTDKYGSVLGSFGINVETYSLPATKFGVDQFFATGAAAENLAMNNPSLRKYFISQAKSAIKATPFSYEGCSATLENWLGEDTDNNSTALNNWIMKNTRPGCEDGVDLMYTESCKDLCQKAANELSTR